MTTLTPTTVNTSMFGKTGFFPVDGKVDAQPLFLSGLTIPGMGTHDVLYVDRDSMGKWNSSSNLIYQNISGALGNSVFSMPAYFNNMVDYGAVGTTLKAFSIINARLSTAAVSASAEAFAYPGTTPGVSAAGGANAIVWAVENTNPAVLDAFDARDLSQELYNSNQAPDGRDAFGAGNKFITPTIVNGHVYVGTTNGVARFGSLLAPPSAPTGLRVF